MTTSVLLPVLVALFFYLWYLRSLEDSFLTWALPGFSTLVVSLPVVLFFSEIFFTGSSFSSSGILFALGESYAIAFFIVLILGFGVAEAIFFPFLVLPLGIGFLCSLAMFVISSE